MLMTVVIIAVIAFLIGRAYGSMPGSGAHMSRPSARLSRTEALKILALPPEAGAEEIKESYRRLLQKLHPDQGGSAYLTDLVVQAKNTLIKEDK